jgi:hypothetical protein
MIQPLYKQFSVWLILLLGTGCSVLWGQTDSARGFSLGVDSIHTTEDMCLMIGARAVGGDFFKGLQAHKDGKRRTFKRHRKAVKSFPEQLIVKIVAGVDRCTGKSTLACDRCDFKLDDEFMKSLQIDAFWKHGFDTRKAEIGVLREEVSDDLATIEPSASLWKYEFPVNSKDVPLTESLLIVLHAPDGRIVSRLSGKP